MSKIAGGPYIMPPSDKLMAEIAVAEEKILKALHGMEPSAKAQACLLVAVAIWHLGGATAEQAKEVAYKAIENIMTARSH